MSTLRANPDLAAPAQRSDDFLTTGLKEVFANPDVYKLGKELRLLVRLLVVEDGKMQGSYDQIGSRVGVDYRTARRYATALEQAGYITVDSSSGGGAVNISIAESILATRHPEPATPLPSDPHVTESDPDLRRIIELYQVAKTNGQTVTVQLSPLVIPAEASP